MNRRSFIIRAGRGLQKISPFFRFLDYPFRVPFLLKNNKNHIPSVFILAPPRSGSTIAYQVLTEAFKNEHLTNVANLLYATPVLGSIISGKLCKNYHTSFQSEKGFVPGICGEAEGLMFWKYWAGQGLIESEGCYRLLRLQKLERLLSLRHRKDRKVYISGYLGHVFCVSLLRKAFPNAIFVHLERNLIDNAASIYRFSKNGRFSLQPQSLDNFQGSKPEWVAHQIIHIQSQIHEQETDDTIRVHYENLCKDPEKEMRRISEFAAKRGIYLQPKSNSKIPGHFDVSYAERNLKEVQQLERIIRKKIDTLPNRKKTYLKRLI